MGGVFPCGSLILSAIMRAMRTHAFKIGAEDFSLERIQQDPEAWQSALARSHREREECLCLCQPGGVRMVVHKRDQFHLRRLANGGAAHHPDCRSHALLDDSMHESTEQPDGLHYPASCFSNRRTQHLRSHRRPTAPANPPASSNGPRPDTLGQILLELWRNAGLCSWRHGFTHKGWGYVNNRLLAASERVTLNGLPIAAMLHLDNTSMEAHRVGSPSARRNLRLVVGEVQSVQQTTRDGFIRLGSGFTAWSDQDLMIHRYRAAQSTLTGVPDARTVAMLSVYWHYNWRVHDVHFQAVTKDWHPFALPEQGNLYGELVNADRQFSIPRSTGNMAPWAILWDSSGGPRALIPASMEAVDSVFPPWYWHGTKLPRKEGAAAMAAEES